MIQSVLEDFAHNCLAACMGNTHVHWRFFSVFSLESFLLIRHIMTDVAASFYFCVLQLHFSAELFSVNTTECTML